MKKWNSKLVIKYKQRKRCEPWVTTPLTDAMLRHRHNALVASSSTSSVQMVSLISTLGLKHVLISTIGLNSILKKMTSPSKKIIFGLKTKPI